MALKIYEWQGKTWQFEEGQQPKDAKLVTKQRKTPANKARATQTK